jgi:hypothetical protein
LFHLGDCPGNGVSIMAPRGLQISSPNQFVDHLTGSNPEGGLNDLLQGLKVQRPVGRGSAGQSIDEAIPGIALPAVLLLERCHSLRGHEFVTRTR